MMCCILLSSIVRRSFLARIPAQLNFLHLASLLASSALASSLFGSSASRHLSIYGSIALQIFAVSPESARGAVAGIWGLPSPHLPSSASELGRALLVQGISSWATPDTPASPPIYLVDSWLRFPVHFDDFSFFLRLHHSLLTRCGCLLHSAAIETSPHLRGFAEAFAPSSRFSWASSRDSSSWPQLRHCCANRVPPTPSCRQQAAHSVPFSFFPFPLLGHRLGSVERIRNHRSRILIFACFEPIGQSPRWVALSAGLTSSTRGRVQARPRPLRYGVSLATEQFGLVTEQILPSLAMTSIGQWLWLTCDVVSQVWSIRWCPCS